MKNLLIKDKAFLRSLYDGPNPLKNKRILNSANDSQLNTLIRYLHFVTTGQIKIKRENFEIVERNKKLKLIKQKVEKKFQLNKLLQSDRTLKIQFLNRLCNIFGAILYILFNESEKIMEYNLLKRIEPNFVNPIANSTYPLLTSTPAIDYINPGIGQISRLYSFYVPLFNNESTHKIEKETEQLGSGVDNNSENNSDIKTNEETDDTSFDPLVYNDRKRKQLGDAVFDSFMHPKFVKTKKISLENSEKKPKQVQRKTDNIKKSKNEMHNFQFY